MVSIEQRRNGLAEEAIKDPRSWSADVTAATISLVCRSLRGKAGRPAAQSGLRSPRETRRGSLGGHQRRCGPGLEVDGGRLLDQVWFERVL